MLPDDWGDGYPNVWLGTTVESETEAARRIPRLLAVPAAVRFLSIEPLLEPFVPVLRDNHGSAVHWVIVGGESGHHFRELKAEWVRRLRDHCVQERVPFFFKQWGGLRPKSGGRSLDGHDWSEFPSPEQL
jgi:protein gp37